MFRASCILAIAKFRTILQTRFFRENRYYILNSLLGQEKSKGVLEKLRKETILKNQEKNHDMSRNIASGGEILISIKQNFSLTAFFPSFG